MQLHLCAGARRVGPRRAALRGGTEFFEAVRLATAEWVGCRGGGDGWLGMHAGHGPAYGVYPIMARTYLWVPISREQGVATLSWLYIFCLVRYIYI